LEIAADVHSLAAPVRLARAVRPRHKRSVEGQAWEHREMSPSSSTLEEAARCLVDLNAEITNNGYRGSLCGSGLVSHSRGFLLSASALCQELMLDTSPVPNGLSTNHLAFSHDGGYWQERASNRSRGSTMAAARREGVTKDEPEACQAAPKHNLPRTSSIEASHSVSVCPG
jgi:hypothetical protein